ASKPGSLSPDLLTDTALEHIRKLNELAAARGQTLAQMAIAWVLRDERVTSALIGASSLKQLDENLDALAAPPFTDVELAAIDAHAVEAGINLWAGSSSIA
ncbi:MAG TPA: aldo/keto reductase, partial [Streptosporangiaceae bacterium]|nr:aldo/keto reductase [Streptosporangiaceae bacterium]